ncbi:energy-coupling factor ABC transporter ATP-binding protein [Salipiger bermudensis]|uniref:energy-coupling factor ABC transporter ATP-binding protein n=1 Tax=Salipiger bermudensis TaxID=344736 RepID=UPI001CD7FB20|nr:ABC transporter ATP-binding protein [Salipiger bermudensis]MCA1288414.1 energy-coupling factor ABC transporter ATP-binding protein [Salipiger bermudensis]
MLQLKNVSVKLGGAQALRQISLTARERRIGIVGRNGSGKTTLARAIAGLQSMDEGSAEIAGRDMARDRKTALRAVGILFQNPDHQIIFPTVEEEIAFGLLQLGNSRAEAAREVKTVLARFGKTHWAAASTHELSQGQKQLVCLMAVLAMRPSLIVLDEPYSGLDIPTRMQLTRYVDEVAAAILHITHDPESVRHYDRVIWIDEGAIRADGPSAEVLPEFEAQMRLWGRCDDLSDLAG